MFIKRVMSSVVLVVLALATILSGGWILALASLAISMVAFRELMVACKLSDPDWRKIRTFDVIGYLSIIFYYLVMLFAQDGRFLILTLFVLLMAFMFGYVFTFPKYRTEQVMCAFFNVAYAPLMLSCIYLTRQMKYGIYIVWMIFISSWICDTCAYLTGICMGKHRLAPKLSPKKSIEGAVGGIVGAALVGALYGFFVVEHVVTTQDITWVFALISAIGAVISQIGDLAASAIKRNHEIKDYGKLIPGHGGIMDRFDSVVFTAPMIYLLALLMITQI